ncbi:hypothetical protein IHE44_0013544, partial [Lamprotornis superbus]
MVKPLRDRDRDQDPDRTEGPGPMMSPPLSPQLAAAPADGFASSDDEAAEEDSTPLHISWFKDIRRNLQKDIGELKSCGIQDIFVLCTRGELSKYRVPNLIDSYQQHGMCVHHYPIPDGNAPDIATCCKILEELRTCLENKQKTMIQLRQEQQADGPVPSNRILQEIQELWDPDSFARVVFMGQISPMCSHRSIQLSDTLAPQQVIESLRNLRGSGAIQTIKQYNFLHDFRENLAAHLATKEPVLRSASRFVLVFTDPELFKVELFPKCNTPGRALPNQTSGDVVAPT